MKYSRAVKLAVEAIDREIQRLAPDANLYELMKMESGRNAALRRSQMKQAKEILTGQPVMEIATAQKESASQ